MPQVRSLRGDDADRYFLRLVPVAPDSSFWTDGDVEVVGARIIADSDTLVLRWARREPTYDELVSRRKALHSPGGYFETKPYSDWYDDYGRSLAYRRFTFVSEYFHLKRPVPDILTIEYELLILDHGTQEPLSRWNLRSEAVVDRHRRWVFIDGIES